jgi:ECF transporter S component (folate family)
MSDGAKKSDIKWIFSIKITLSTVVTLALLIAMEIIFTRFLSIQQWNMRFSFGFIPVVVAGIMYGPMAGGIVGALSDLIGVTLFPAGAFFPGFTLTAFLTGFAFGLFLYKKQTMVRIVAATLLIQVVCSLILNTYWIYLLYSKTSYFALLSTRLIQFFIMSAVMIIVIRIISKELLPRLKMALSR